MNPISKVSKIRIQSPLGAGILYALAVMLGAALIVSLVVWASSMKEESMPGYIYVIHGIALLVGGFVAGRRAGRKGWYYGGIIGLLYSLIILLIAFLGFDASLQPRLLPLLAGSFAIAALGGILGVNSRS